MGDNLDPIDYPPPSEPLRLRRLDSLLPNQNSQYNHSSIPADDARVEPDVELGKPASLSEHVRLFNPFSKKIPSDGQVYGALSLLHCQLVDSILC